MIEIQCTSCQTRYRIDERILPDETPTFKCSRCGHVFSAEPRKKPPPRSARPEGARSAASAAKSAASGADVAKPPSPSTGTNAAAQAPAPAAKQPAVAPAAAPAAPEPTFKPHTADSGDSGAAAQPMTEPERDAEPQATNPARSDATQAAKPEGSAPRQHRTEELLEQSFKKNQSTEASKTGDNLSFDFSDEPRTPDDQDDSTPQKYADETWEVGETEVPPASPRPKRRIRITDVNVDAEEALNRDHELRGEERDAGIDFERIRPEKVSAETNRLEAELRGRPYTLHSAGFFVALFALIIFGFGILTMLICGAPIASAQLLSALPGVGADLEPPISPARRVALGEVEARYATLKGNQTALVISGTAENVSSAPLGAVRIEAALTGPGSATLRRQAIYCGNNLSSKMLSEMTPHEIEFFEKLDAPKSFTLTPQATSPFMIVFIAPPAGASQFQLRVAGADLAAASPPSPAGG